MEGDSADYFACIMENVSVVLVLKVGFGGTDGDQRNEGNLESLSFNMQQSGKCTWTSMGEGPGMKGK